MGLKRIISQWTNLASYQTVGWDISGKKCRRNDRLSIQPFQWLDRQDLSRVLQNALGMVDIIKKPIIKTILASLQNPGEPDKLTLRQIPIWPLIGKRID
jgi:hypothetical protein